MLIGAGAAFVVGSLFASASSVPTGWLIGVGFLAAFPAAGLKESRFNLARHHDDIVAALDMLFQGF